MCKLVHVIFILFFVQDSACFEGISKRAVPSLPTLPGSRMAPKRARTAATRASASSSSSPADAAAPKLTLHGGVPHHPSLAGLWRDERLTDRRLGSVGEHESEAQRPCLGGA